MQLRFTSALTAVLAMSAATAFVPSGSSSFVGRKVTYTAPPSSTTVLQMNLFDRFSRVAKANLNGILQNLEDPEKIMTQALEDMQGDLVKIRQSYAEVTATQRRLLKQKEQADAVSQDWFKRAQLALEKGNDGLAKEALTRRQTASEEADTLQNQIDVQASSIDKLYEGMQMIEKKIMEAKSKKEQMVARARTAQSTQKVNDMLGGVTGKTSMDAFTRMEDKVEALEAAAEVSQEMGRMGELPGSTDIERQFKMLEATSSVDDELEQMKKNLLSAAPSADAGGAASGSASSSANKGVDDELEKLKREAGL